LLFISPLLALGRFPDWLDHAGEAGRREWRTALRREHKRAPRLLFSAQPP
jgi:hypothetical protein